MPDGKKDFFRTVKSHSELHHEINSTMQPE